MLLVGFSYVTGVNIREAECPNPRLSAVTARIDLNEWQAAHIKAALAEDEQGGSGVPHTDVAAWMDSWGTDHELPRPDRFASEANVNMAFQKFSRD